MTLPSVRYSACIYGCTMYTILWVLHWHVLGSRQYTFSPDSSLHGGTAQVLLPPSTLSWEAILALTHNDHKVPLVLLVPVAPSIPLSHSWLSQQDLGSLEIPPALISCCISLGEWLRGQSEHSGWHHSLWAECLHYACNAGYSQALLRWIYSIQSTGLLEACLWKVPLYRRA